MKQVGSFSYASVSKKKEDRRDLHDRYQKIRAAWKFVNLQGSRRAKQVAESQVKHMAVDAQGT